MQKRKRKKTTLDSYCENVCIKPLNWKEHMEKDMKQIPLQKAIIWLHLRRK